MIFFILIFPFDSTESGAKTILKSAQQISDTVFKFDPRIASGFF